MIEEREDRLVENSKIKTSQKEEDDISFLVDRESDYEFFLEQEKELDRMCEETNIKGKITLGREKLVSIQMHR